MYKTSDDQSEDQNDDKCWQSLVGFVSRSPFVRPNNELNLSREIIQTIATKYLDKHKLCVTFVPQHLINEQKPQRLQSCVDSNTSMNIVRNAFHPAGSTSKDSYVLQIYIIVIFFALSHLIYRSRQYF